MGGDRRPRLVPMDRGAADPIRELAKATMDRRTITATTRPITAISLTNCVDRKGQSLTPSRNLEGRVRHKEFMDIFERPNARYAASGRPYRARADCASGIPEGVQCLTKSITGERHSRYFMAPVWISLALCGMVASFLLGGALVTDEWSRQDNDRLAPYKPGGLFAEPGASEPTATARGDGAGGAPGTGETSPLKPASVSDLVWKSPASALECAAEGVKHDRIEFAVYRQFVARCAWRNRTAGAHAIVSQHPRRARYGGASPRISRPNSRAWRHRFSSPRRRPGR